jgi:cytochrome b6-f complex iron-sulfur subunit
MASVSRRKFMKIAGWAAAVTGFAAVSVPIVAYFYPKDLEEIPSEPVVVGPPDELPVGQSKLVAFGRYPALVINTTEGLRAYSAVCTHFACLVKWNPDSGKIECPCHDGFFDPLDGSVISGPPPEPLLRFDVYVGDDGRIYVAQGEEEE